MAKVDKMSEEMGQLFAHAEQQVSKAGEVQIQESIVMSICCQNGDKMEGE